MTTLRWTEHGPEPVEPVELPEPAAEPAEPAAAIEQTTEPVEVADAGAAHSDVPEDLVTAWQRLTAKGLVREQPAVRIREVTPDAPRVVFEPEPFLTTGNAIANDDLGDPEELEPEQPGPTTKIRCATCRTQQQVADAATGFRCTSCAKVFRWAICGGCHEVRLTIARQESWRCECGAYTRSWWRTTTATKAAEHRRTSETRVTQAADRRRQEAYAKARRRRWKLLSVGAVAILATAVAAVTFSRHAAPITTKGANGKVCDAFADVQRGINAQTSPAELRASIDALAAESVDAIDRIRLPAQQMAGSGHPGDKPFDDAAKALARACAG